MKKQSRPLVLTLAALLLASANHVLADDVPEPPRLEFETYTLANGLKVILQRDASIPRVTVAIAYHVGSKNERAGRTGFAHFFEHMMFRGTKNVPNYDIPFQEAGTQTNAFTTEDVTLYHESLPSNYLERALYLEAERLAFLPTALDKEKFDTEREVVKNERRQHYENVPYGLVEEAILANVFPKGHPYSWSVIGSMKDLNNATLDDLKAFFAEFYHPGNATLCLSGDFDPATAKKWIATYFEPIPAGPKPRPVAVAETPPVSGDVRLLDRVQLSRVYFAWPTVPSDHADSAALDVLGRILAGGDASRLHRSLVLEKRVATDVDAGDDAKEIGGLFTIDATAAEGKALADCEAAIDAEIARIQAEPPTAEEMRRTIAKRENAITQGLARTLSRATILALGSAVHNDPAHYRRDFEKLVATTPAQVQAVAKKYLVKDRVRVRVEPMSPGQSKSEAIAVGPLPSDEKPVEARSTKIAGGTDWTRLPDPGPMPTFQPPEIIRKQLSNGVELWCVPWRSLPIVSLEIAIGVGTADDPPGREGLAMLLSRLLDKGTATKSATELTEAFEALGGQPSVSVGTDHLRVGFACVSRQLDPALGLLGTMLRSPRFDPDDFARERDLLLADLLQGPDSVGWIARRVFPMLLHGRTSPYGQPGEGYSDSVKRIKLDGVRALHSARVRPQAVRLLVVGDVDPEAVSSMAEKLWPKQPDASNAPGPRRESESPPVQPVVYFVDKPGAVQSFLMVGRLWKARNDASYYATVIGNHAFGGDFLSRLNQNLRERNGYTYGAGSAFGYNRDGGTWRMATTVRTDATAPALKEVDAELAGLRGKRPLSAEEIATARAAEVRSYPEEFESPGGILAAVEEIAQFKLPLDTLAQTIPNLQAVKSQTLDKAMRELADPAPRIILIVGDRKEVEPKLKELGFDKIVLLNSDGNPAKP